MFLGLASRITRLAGDSPSLALDLARSSLDGRLSFSRASGATDVIDGVLTTYATDAPRCSASNGLLIEEARTNSLRNAAGGGSTAGVVGSGGALPTNWAIEQTAGLTTQVVGTGTANGFSYVRLSISGTPTATAWQLRFESNTQVGAAQNQSWSASLYAALSGGALTNISSVDVRCAESTAACSWSKALLRRAIFPPPQPLPPALPMPAAWAQACGSALPRAHCLPMRLRAQG
jgi:hypothetical protein